MKTKPPLVLILAAHLSEAEDFLALHANGKTGNYFSYKEVQFTLSAHDDYDFIAVFNTVPKSQVYRFPKNKVLFFMMEPGLKLFHSFMFGIEQNAIHLFSPIHSKNPSHGYLGWSIPKSVSILSMELPFVKTKKCSAISSKTMILPGHYQRLAYLTQLAKQHIPFDLFGRGFKTIENKLEALNPYQYSITIENGTFEHYFTEKINDALLCWTVPFYIGAPNIHSYFPEEAVVQLPENDAKLGAEIIQEVLKNPTNYDARLDAIREAKKRICNDYNPLAKIAKVVKSLETKTNDSEMIQLENRDCPVWKRRIASNYLKLKHQLKIKAKTEIDFGLLESKIPH